MPGGQSALTIVCMTNRSDDFYPLMGPSLSRREIVAELGSPVWDDDGKTWHIAVEDDRAVGFCARVPQRDAVRFCSDYVVTDRRRRGIYDRLMRDRMAAVDADPVIKATATAASVGTFRRYGFQEVGVRGTFTLVEFWTRTLGIGWPE